MKKTNKIPPQGIVTGVSLGPGDPGLITMKGLQALKEADRIYYPGSKFSDGREDSYSLAILKHYNLDPEKLKGFYLKMSLDRQEAELLYEEVFQRLVGDYEKGMKIVIVSEGDLSTYSSFSYLLQKIKKAHLKVELIPGITSFTTASATHQVPLGLQHEKVGILPRVQSEHELTQSLNTYDTLILMKIRSVKSLVMKVIGSMQLSVFYGEKLGTANEFTSTDLEEIQQRDIPYFALMIIKK